MMLDFYSEREGCELWEENDRLRDLLEKNNIDIPDPSARAYACPALAEMLGMPPQPLFVKGGYVRPSKEKS